MGGFRSFRERVRPEHFICTAPAARARADRDDADVGGGPAVPQTDRQRHDGGGSDASCVHAPCSSGRGGIPSEDLHIEQGRRLCPATVGVVEHCPADLSEMKRRCGASGHGWCASPVLVLWLWSIKLLALAHLATAPKVISDDLRWRVVWMYVDDNMTYDQIGRMQRLSPETCRGIVSRYEEHGTPVADFRRKRTRCIPCAVQFICRPSFPHDEPVGLPPHDMSLCFDRQARLF